MHEGKVFGRTRRTERRCAAIFKRACAGIWCGGRKFLKRRFRCGRFFGGTQSRETRGRGDTKTRGPWSCRYRFGRRRRWGRAKLRSGELGVKRALKDAATRRRTGT